MSTNILLEASMCVNKGNISGALELANILSGAESVALKAILMQLASVNAKDVRDLLGEGLINYGLKDMVFVLRKITYHISLSLPHKLALARHILSGIPEFQPKTSGAILDCPPFLNVLGTSHARSFGANSYYLPIFAGIGRTMLVLTEESFRLTREKVSQNLRRLDKSQDIMLILGGEPRLHYENFLNTRSQSGGYLSDDDFQLMDLVGQRYMEIAKEVETQVNGKVAIYNVLPTFDPKVNLLTERLNKEIALLCTGSSILFVNVINDLMDSKTGGIREEFTAHAYEGDFHLGIKALPVITDKFKELGLVPDYASTANDFDWNYVFTFQFSPHEPSRIWCEPNVSPNNAFSSWKIAATFVAGRAIEYIIGHFVFNNMVQNITFINSMEGFLPLHFPLGISNSLKAVSLNDKENAMAVRIANIMGRHDCHFTIVNQEAAAPINEKEMLVYTILPHQADDQRKVFNSFMSRNEFKYCVVIAPDNGYINRLSINGWKLVDGMEIGNHHLQPEWQKMVIFLLCRV